VNRAGRPEPLRNSFRTLVLAALVLAPWALGATHALAYVPLLAVAYLAGLTSWARGHWARAHGHPTPLVPGTAILAALLALPLFQLVPLPPALLRLVSPGSFAYYSFVTLGPELGWRPISVSPPDTLRGVVFAGGLVLLYAFAFRELGSHRWRRYVVVAVVTGATLMTAAALVQAQSAEPSRILGVYKPPWDWAVFGPYVNKNHFAGYVALSVPLALAWTLNAWSALRAEWCRRSLRRWLAIGEKAGHILVLRVALTLFLLVGIFAAGSRGALLAVCAGVVVAPLLARRRWPGRLALSLATATVVVLFATGTLSNLASRGMRDIRFAIWPSALRMVPDFPWLGSGLNTFGTAFMRYRAFKSNDWVGEAHNDFLQSLTDTGVIGAGLVAVFAARLVLGAARHAGSGVLGAGLLGSVLVSCANACVDFNWQIPANAATFAVLAGLAMRGGGAARDAHPDQPT